MQCDNPVEELARALYTVMERAYPDRHSYPAGFRIYHFTQEWGSTALGFGGLGGASSTTAMTTVIGRGNLWVVCFGGRIAYSLEKPNELFYEDLRKHYMASVDEHIKYLG